MKYCGTTTGNQWTTENTNLILHSKDVDLLAHRAVHFLAVSFCQIVNRLTNPVCVRYAIDSASCTA